MLAETRRVSDNGLARLRIVLVPQQGDHAGLAPRGTNKRPIEVSSTTIRSKSSGALFVAPKAAGPRIGLDLQAGLHHASEPRGRRRGPRARRLLQHPRLALVARSRGPARKLALHNLRDHADQLPSDEHAGRGRRGRNAPHGPVVGRSSCRAKFSWPRRDSNLPVGSAMRPALTAPRRDQPIRRGVPKRDQGFESFSLQRSAAS